MVEHADGTFDGFSKKYGIKLLVYYEMHATMEQAIQREKQMKEWKRLWKIRLIQSLNPEWNNLYDRATGSIGYGTGDREARETPDQDY
jgi:putative endonuclease